MKNKEPSRLQNLAHALSARNHKNAVRICRNQMTAALTPGKQAVYELWHQQLTKPDNKPIEMIAYGKRVTIIPSEYELMNLLKNGVNAVRFGDIKETFRQHMIDLEFQYYNARLSYLLMGYYEEVKQSSKEKPSPKKTRTHLNDATPRMDAATTKT